MSRARRRRYAVRWQRYADRFIKPENGGMINTADQIGHIKANFRAGGIRWNPDVVRMWRWARTTRTPARVKR